MIMILTREWVGIQQFPAATQTKLHEILGKLKQENVNTMTILVMGKGGVGKSSTVNSILGERVATVSAFQSEGLRPIMCSRTRAGFTLNVIYTPGIVEGGYVNGQALEIIKRFLLDKTINVLLYVDRLDSYRVDNLDRQVVKAITDFLGKEIWQRGVVVLTHAQLSPPDGLNYDDFLEKRSEALLKYIRSGAEIKKKEFQIMVHKSSPRGTHFRRAGPRQKVYFESDEVHACIVTCGGLCHGPNTVIREIVCGLSHMYGVTKILGFEKMLLPCGPPPETKA